MVTRRECSRDGRSACSRWQVNRSSRWSPRGRSEDPEHRGRRSHARGRQTAASRRRWSRQARGVDLGPDRQPGGRRVRAHVMDHHPECDRVGPVGLAVLPPVTDGQREGHELAPVDVRGHGWDRPGRMPRRRLGSPRESTARWRLRPWRRSAGVVPVVVAGVVIDTVAPPSRIAQLGPGGTEVLAEQQADRCRKWQQGEGAQSSHGRQDERRRCSSPPAHER